MLLNDLENDTTILVVVGLLFNDQEIWFDLKDGGFPIASEKKEEEEHARNVVERKRWLNF